MVQGGEHKVLRLVLQCTIGVSSNPVEGRTQICQLKDIILARLYIYIYIPDRSYSRHGPCALDYTSTLLYMFFFYLMYSTCTCHIY